ADRVASRLRENDKVARTVQLKLRYRDFTTITRARTLPEATDLAATIGAEARVLLDAVDLRDGIRLLGVTAMQLDDAVAVQGQLTRAGLVDAGITATFDPDHDRAEQTARHHEGAVAHPTLGAALDDVDVAWICTWTAGHAEAVDAAVARGLAVFCEKPLAPTIDGCRAIAASLRGRPHQVGLVLRHAP